MTVCSAGDEGPADLVAAIDTGASNVIIPPRVARRLGYAVEIAPVDRLVTGAGAVSAPRIIVARIGVGGVSAADVETLCHDLPEEAIVDALVGLSFLTRFHVGFDFDSWEMELTPRA